MKARHLVAGTILFAVLVGIYNTLDLYVDPRSRTSDFIKTAIMFVTLYSMHKASKKEDFLDYEPTLLMYVAAILVFVGSFLIPIVLL